MAATRGSGSASSTSTGDLQTEEVAAEEQLPKLTPPQYRQYNRLATQMDQFHNGFRLSWNQLYSACENNQRPKSLSLLQFLSLGLRFAEHLEMHHSIEETYFFPMLARKMPAFQKQDHLLAQHRQIHVGLDKFVEYLKECRKGERELVLSELKVIMELFGEVLWQHLDDEVRQLGAENMRRYWTVEEVNGMGH